MLDKAAAAVLLLIGLPIMAVLVVLVRLTSRGPGIFRQVRVGKDGRQFLMYKIRTMRQDAEAATGPVWTQTSDPRVTRLGRLLRKLHLDELPQLFNVLRGEMSLIGPRPERPEFVRVLAEAIPGYTARLAVRPGVTGLAQVNLPPDSDLDSVWRKLILDVEYIRHAGLGLDVRLFLATFARMFKVPEGWVLPVLRLRRDVVLPVADAVSSDGSPPPTTEILKESTASRARARDYLPQGHDHVPKQRHDRRPMRAE
jgi:lipopolysaccharide/colanic/teichoic acid biosynthesis glycosyltransferase